MNSSTSNCKDIGLSGSNQEPPGRSLRRNASDFIPEVFLQQLPDRKRGKRKVGRCSQLLLDKNEKSFIQFVIK